MLTLYGGEWEKEVFNPSVKTLKTFVSKNIGGQNNQGVGKSVVASV